jgi:hypothetical protein
MKFRCILWVLTVFGVCCCSTNYRSKEHMILDKDLLQAYEDLDKSNTINRSPLLFQSSFSADDCESYTKMRSSSEIVETVNNQLVKSEYLVCDALRILSESKMISGAVNSELKGQQLLNKLDLRSFPNSLHRLANDSSFTLSSLFASSSVADKISVKYETADWILTIKVVAVVLLNSNADEDWVVQLADESKAGNYRNYQTLIIYDPLVSDFFSAKALS